jgi:hypothetical protein
MKGDHKMGVQRSLVAIILLGIVAAGCDYIVPPISYDSPTPVTGNGWAGIANGVSTANGSLHVDLSIVNNTNDWSAMDVGASTAKVADSSGKTSDCGKVTVGTSVFVENGGWFLPAGFVMRGYTSGSNDAPTTNLLSVECAGVAPAAGQKLAISYRYMTGQWNYYVPSTYVTAVMEVNLDKVASDTKYPIATSVDSVKLSKVGDAIDGINGFTVKLTGVERTATGLKFAWECSNPTAYNNFIHIGVPPVIGDDGILYGPYLSPHLANAPITPSAANGVNGDATWATTVTAPAGVKGLYILVPVETKQTKYFVDHVIDISDK